MPWRRFIYMENFIAFFKGKTAGKGENHASKYWEKYIKFMKGKSTIHVIFIVRQLQEKDGRKWEDVLCF